MTSGVSGVQGSSTPRGELKDDPGQDEEDEEDEEGEA